MKKLKSIIQGILPIYLVMHPYKMKFISKEFTTILHVYCTVYNSHFIDQ